MQPHEALRPKNLDQEHPQRNASLYGATFDLMKQRLIDGNSAGRLIFRYFAGKTTHLPNESDFDKRDNVFIPIKNIVRETELAISPPQMTLDVGELNMLAESVALDPEQVRRGYTFSRGRFHPKEGFTFPVISLDETLAQVQKAVVFDFSLDPFAQAETLLKEEMEKDLQSAENGKLLRFIQRTKVVIYPSAHIAQLVGVFGEKSRDMLIDLAPNSGKNNLSLTPKMIKALEEVMRKENPDTRPIGDLEWLKKALGI